MLVAPEKADTEYFPNLNQVVLVSKPDRKHVEEYEIDNWT